MQAPISFQVPYDPSKIEQSHRYNLLVKIEDRSGQLQFITDTVTLVINGGPTQNVHVTLVQVPR